MTMFYLKNISNMPEWNIQNQHKMDVKSNLHVIDMILNFKTKGEVCITSHEPLSHVTSHEPLRQVYHRIMISTCL